MKFHFIWKSTRRETERKCHPGCLIFQPEYFRACKFSIFTNHSLNLKLSKVTEEKRKCQSRIQLVITFTNY